MKNYNPLHSTSVDNFESSQNFGFSYAAVIMKCFNTFWNWFCAFYLLWIFIFWYRTLFHQGTVQWVPVFSTCLQLSRKTRQTYFKNLLSTLCYMADKLSWFSRAWDLVKNISLNPSIVLKKGKRVEESVNFWKTAGLVRLTMPYYSVLLVGSVLLRAYHLYLSKQCSM